MAHEDKGGTKGRQQLVRWMKAGSLRERGQSALARALGLSQASVRQWVEGNTRPDEANRIALEALTGIPKEDWATAEERRALDRALKRIARSAPPSP